MEESFSNLLLNFLLKMNPLTQYKNSNSSLNYEKYLKIENMNSTKLFIPFLKFLLHLIEILFKHLNQSILINFPPFYLVAT